MPKQKTKKTEEKSIEANVSAQDFEARVVALAGTGLTAEKIGEKLRSEGIHPSKHGKISRILKQKKLYEVPEIKNIQEKLARVTAQMEKNAQDKRAMREKDRLFSLLRKSKEYHKISQ